MPWLPPLTPAPFAVDQWIARGAAVAAAVLVAVASGCRSHFPVVATLLLTGGALLFIFSFWIAARNRIRWLDSAAIALFVFVIVLCSYQVIRVGSHPQTQPQPVPTNASDSAMPEVRSVPQ
jgi:hypothetical protein